LNPPNILDSDLLDKTDIKVKKEKEIQD